MIWLSFFVKTGVVELCLVFVDFAAIFLWVGLGRAGLCWPGLAWVHLGWAAPSLSLSHSRPFFRSAGFSAGDAGEGGVGGREERRGWGILKRGGRKL